MDMVRLGIIGFGGMGRNILRQSAELSQAEATAVVDTRQDRRTEAAEDHDLLAFESTTALIDADVADAVYVATPNKFHAPVTIECLRGGLHVFCEKPIAMNADEGAEMIAVAEETGRKLTINLSSRTDGSVRALKGAVDEGLLGDVYFARTRWMRNRGIPGMRGWFVRKDLAGGGPLIDLGVHRIDLALWLMGHPKPVSVTGVTYDALGRRLAAEKGEEFSVEDLAAGFVRFDNGASLSLVASWAANSEWAEDMATEVYGTEAGGAHRSIGGKYAFETRLWGEMGGTFAETVLHPVPGPSHLEAFVDSIINDTPVPVDPVDALHAQQIIDGLYESARTGKEVRL